MKIIRLLATAALVALAPLAGFGAEPFPGKQIRFVVPYPPGGPLDTVARLLGQKVSAQHQAPGRVDNVPGAGGNIGAGVVARAAPDGYTILMGAVATHAINPTLYSTIPYNAEKDFIAVTQLASTPNVLVVNPAVAGELGRGIHQAREVEARQAQLRLRKHGQRRPPRRRALQVDGGRGHGPHPLQGRGGGDAGPHRRAAWTSCSTTSPRRSRR